MPVIETPVSLPKNPIPLVQLRDIHKTFRLGKQELLALKSINLEASKGETIGIAGESGCGKSTLGKLALGLDQPSKGNVYFEGSDIFQLMHKDSLSLRRKMQVVFQDPYSSLNPRMTIESIIGEGIDIHRLASGTARQDKIIHLLEQVSLSTEALHRYPHQFSGGQRQRIAIARALAVDPLFMVCDEPLSALDACTQRQVLELLIKLKAERQLTYFFISHDLHAMRQLADTIAVMYLGNIVEKGPTAPIFSSPQHPYTQALMGAIPAPFSNKKQEKLKILVRGEPPSPLFPPLGCPFHPRCPKALPQCRTQTPPLEVKSCGHLVACHAVSK